MAHFERKDFLKKTSNKLLARYFQEKHNIFQELKIDSLKPKKIDVIDNQINDLDSSILKKIESDFQLIFEICNKEGKQTILDHAKAKDIDIPSEFKTYNDISLWAFLDKKEEIFDFAICIYSVNSSKSVGLSLSKNTGNICLGEEEKARLRDMMIGFFTSKNRDKGRNCKIVYETQEGWHKICVRLQDEPKHSDEWVENDIKTFERDFVFDVIFYYDSVQNKVYTYSEEHKNTKKHLQGLFVEACFSKKLTKEELNQWEYNLEPLKDRNFEFKTSGIDDLSIVKIDVLGLEFEASADSAVKKMGLYVHNSKNALYDAIERGFSYYNKEETGKTYIGDITIKSATIKVHIDIGKETLKSKTIKITVPNTCYLDKYGIDLKLHDVLMNSGIARQNVIKKESTETVEKKLEIA